MTVAELKHRMSSVEFEQWQIVYYKLEPFSDLRADLRSGLAAAAIVNGIRTFMSVFIGDKGLKIASPEEFIVKMKEAISKTSDEPPGVQTLDEMKAVLDDLKREWEAQNG